MALLHDRSGGVYVLPSQEHPCGAAEFPALSRSGMDVGPSLFPRPSAWFIDYVAHTLDGTLCDLHGWANQVAERLSSNADLRARAAMRLDRLLTSAPAQVALLRARDWFQSLSAGRWNDLDALHQRVRFIVIVGAPRSGGSYLTAELFSALGHDPAGIPASFGHDGFPESGPFGATQGHNAWIECLSTTAEYLTMVEMFAAGQPADSPVIIPKKMTKAAYAGGFFRAVLGPNAEYLLTLRHPAASCVSTYEKSGGLPADGCLRARSAIERWIARDLAHAGINAASMDYFDAYLKYWELYHIMLATGGLTASRAARIVPFDPTGLEGVSQDFQSRFGGGLASPFRSPEGVGNPCWQDDAAPVIVRVATIWETVGLEFPSKALLACT